MIVVTRAGDIFVAEDQRDHPGFEKWLGAESWSFGELLGLMCADGRQPRPADWQKQIKEKRATDVAQRRLKYSRGKSKSGYQEDPVDYCNDIARGVMDSMYTNDDE